MTDPLRRHAARALLLLLGAGAFAGAWAQPAGQPVGFASLDGGTSGGDPANTCMVQDSDESALQAAIDCTQKSAKGGVVRFAPAAAGRPIVLRKRIDLPSNITIQGPATLQTRAAGMLSIAGQRNVIVRDIVFETLPQGSSKKGELCPDPTAPDTVAVGKGDDLGTTACTVPITIQGSKNRKGRAPEQVADSKNIWIDHNTFIRCGDKCITIKNGAKAPSGRFAGADNITLSHNRFQQSFFGVLITVINSDEGGARALVKRDTEKCAVVAASGVLPQTRVTIHGNLFEDVRRRMVRVAYCNSYGHEFNNAILGFGMPMSKYPAGATCDRSAFGFGPSAHSGGRLLLENNYIAAHPNDPNGCKAAVDTGGKGEDEGFVKDVGNLYANGATGGSNGAQHVAAPPYQYQMLPASQVLESVKRNAGARGR